MHTANETQRERHGWRLARPGRTNMKLGLRTSFLSMLAVIGIAAVAVSSLLLIETARAETSGQFPPPDNFVVTRGHTVTIGTSPTADAAWESMTGGSLRIEYGDSSVGTDQFHNTTPGHKNVAAVTLRGPVVAGSAAGTFTSLTVDSLSSAMGAAEIDGEIHQDGAGNFSIDIDGLPTFSNNVSSIEIEPMTIDVIETTTAADFEYRKYGPGASHLGMMTISSHRSASGAAEASEWWEVGSAGNLGARKNLSVIALKRDGSEGRRWDFFDCVPVTYHPFSGFSPDSSAVLETLTIACGRVEFSGGRNDITQWINDTVHGSEWQRDVAIAEVLQDGSEGAPYTYIDAFPTRYVFPSFSASGTGNLYEEITFKPIRLEVN